LQLSVTIGGNNYRQSINSSIFAAVSNATILYKKQKDASICLVNVDISFALSAERDGDNFIYATHFDTLSKGKITKQQMDRSHNVQIMQSSYVRPLVKFYGH
jgi:hypothetical protein